MHKANQNPRKHGCENLQLIQIISLQLIPVINLQFILIISFHGNFTFQGANGTFSCSVDIDREEKHIHPPENLIKLSLL